MIKIFGKIDPKNKNYRAVILTLLTILNFAHFSHGGSCWLNINKNGLCTNLLKTWSSSKSDCCNSGLSSVAWSETDMNPSSFFYMHLTGGEKCTRCKDSCEGVECPKDYTCKMRNNEPKCVCAPNCSAYRRAVKSTHKPGPVCGTDGLSYKSTCRLLKRSCRKKVGISVAYYGLCKMTCSKLKCPGKKKCVLDQNMMPHCVNCSTKKCSVGIETKYFFSRGSGLNTTRVQPQVICGNDGITYSSICHLREAACQRGKAIPIAYNGSCQKNPSCSTVVCNDGQSCLIEPLTGNPRCVTCTQCHLNLFTQNSVNFQNSPLTNLTKFGRFKIQSLQKSSSNGPICSTNNKSYTNYCQMILEGCNSGIALDTLYFGKCI